MLRDGCVMLGELVTGPGKRKHMCRSQLSCYRVGVGGGRGSSRGGEGGSAVFYCIQSKHVHTFPGSLLVEIRSAILFRGRWSCQNDDWRSVKLYRLGTGDWGQGTGDWGLGTGDWGLGTGDWGLGTGDWGLGTGDWGLGTERG